MNRQEGQTTGWHYSQQNKLLLCDHDKPSDRLQRYIDPLNRQWWTVDNYKASKPSGQTSQVVNIYSIKTLDRHVCVCVYACWKEEWDNILTKTTDGTCRLYYSCWWTEEPPTLSRTKSIRKKSVPSYSLFPNGDKTLYSGRHGKPNVSSLNSCNNMSINWSRDRLLCISVVAAAMAPGFLNPQPTIWYYGLLKGTYTNETVTVFEKQTSCVPCGWTATLTSLYVEGARRHSQATRHSSVVVKTDMVGIPTNWKQTIPLLSLLI